MNPGCLLSFARDNQPDSIRFAVEELGIPVDWSNAVSDAAQF